MDEAESTNPPGTRGVAGFAPAERGCSVALATGDRGRARIVVRELISGAVPLPTGDAWLHAIGLLSLAALDVGDGSIAVDLYRLLGPYPTLTCGIGYRSFVGPAALHLGCLAAMAREWADAERHLASALAQLTPRDPNRGSLNQHTLARVLEGRGRSSDRNSIDALRAEATWITTIFFARSPAIRPLATDHLYCPRRPVPSTRPSRLQRRSCATFAGLLGRRFRPAVEDSDA